jgi:hypothetical protein
VGYIERLSRRGREREGERGRGRERGREKEREKESPGSVPWGTDRGCSYKGTLSSCPLPPKSWAALLSPSSECGDMGLHNQGSGPKLGSRVVFWGLGDGSHGV